MQLLQVCTIYDKQNVIVGAGTAGSVLAYELSKNTNYSVLLIEAGGIFGTLASVPMLSPVMQLSSVDYSFKTQLQKFSSKGFVGQVHVLEL